MNVHDWIVLNDRVFLRITRGYDAGLQSCT